MIDTPAVRADTPGIAFVAHFNNAGASLMPRPVLETITGYLDEESRLGGYETADAFATELEGVYDALARLIGADRSEIAIADSATRAWDLAFTALHFTRGDRILTTTSEYASNVIAFLQVAERTGVIVEVVPDRPTGEIDVDALERMIDERVRLIAINHMPTNGGLVNPAADVGRVANAYGVPYLLDACQSVGQIPVDVEEIGCDEMRTDARRFELWERSPALALGLGRAAAYAMDVGVESIWERVLELSETLRGALSGVAGVTVRDIGTVRGAIVTFTVDGCDAAMVKRALHAQAMNVSVVTPYSARFDMEARSLPNLVRASVHYFNTEDEIDRLVAVVAAL